METESVEITIPIIQVRDLIELLHKKLDSFAKCGKQFMFTDIDSSDSHFVSINIVDCFGSDSIESLISSLHLLSPETKSVVIEDMNVHPDVIGRYRYNEGWLTSELLFSEEFIDRFQLYPITSYKNVILSFI